MSMTAQEVMALIHVAVEGRVREMLDQTAGQIQGLAEAALDAAQAGRFNERLGREDAAVYEHPFKTRPHGIGEDELPQVSIAPGLFIAGLHAQGYNPTPTEAGIELVDSGDVVVPTGMIEIPRTIVGGIALSSKTVILFSAEYIRKGCKAGSTPDDPMTIVIEDPGDTNLFLSQWYCTNATIAKSRCTEASGQITLIDIGFSSVPAENVYYPISVVTTDAVGITNIRQIVRSDFREPLSGSLEAYTA